MSKLSPARASCSAPGGVGRHPDSRRGFSLEPAGVSIDASRRRPHPPRTARPVCRAIWAVPSTEGLWAESRPSPISTVIAGRRWSTLKGLVPYCAARAVVLPTITTGGTGSVPRPGGPGRSISRGETTSRTTAFAPMSLSGLLPAIRAEPYLSANVAADAGRNARLDGVLQLPPGQLASDLPHPNGAPSLQCEVAGVAMRTGDRRPDDRRTNTPTQSGASPIFAPGIRRGAPVPGGLRAQRQQQGVDRKFWGNMAGSRARLSPGFRHALYSNGGNVSTNHARRNGEAASSFVKSRRPSWSSGAARTYDTQKAGGPAVRDGACGTHGFPRANQVWRLFQQITMRSAVARAWVST